MWKSARALALPPGTAAGRRLADDESARSRPACARIPPRRDANGNPSMARKGPCYKNATPGAVDIEAISGGE